MIQSKIYQPLILDDEHNLRLRVSNLYRITRIEKRALVGKALHLGLKLLEEQVNAQKTTTQQGDL